MSGQDLGKRFAEAIAAKDSDAVAAVLAPDVDFKGLTPGRFWEASEIGGVLDILFENWFEESDRIDEVLDVATGQSVEDTHEVGYRFAVSNDDGPHTVGQQAYYRTDGDRIVYLRLVCSGWRPVGR